MQRRPFATALYKIRDGRPFLVNRACKSSIQTVFFFYSLTTATIFNATAEKRKQIACETTLEKEYGNVKEYHINAAALDLVRLRPWITMVTFNRLCMSKSFARRACWQDAYFETLTRTHHKLRQRSGNIIWSSTVWCNEIGSLTSLMHVTQVHPVTTENRFHCTRLYT